MKLIRGKEIGDNILNGPVDLTIRLMAKHGGGSLWDYSNGQLLRAINWPTSGESVANDE